MIIHLRIETIISGLKEAGRKGYRPGSPLGLTHELRRDTCQWGESSS